MAETSAARLGGFLRALAGIVRPRTTTVAAPHPPATSLQPAEPARPATPARVPASPREVQDLLVALGLLDPPADGVLGPVSRWALDEACRSVGQHVPAEMTPAVCAALASARPLPLSPGAGPRSGPGAGLTGAIVRAMQARGHWIARHPDCLNIVYVEGMNVDGTRNDNAPNAFNDLRCLIRVVGGVPVMAGAWQATTEPSRRWTERPMNPRGAARIAFGQYKAWAVGMHHDHEALVQVADIAVFRDANKDYRRDGDRTDVGLFGVNQHWGYDLPANDLGNSSAGCLVGRSTAGHREFMRLIRSDRRYLVSNGAYRFLTTVLPAAAVQNVASSE
jgi:hypothetical protein